MKVKENKILIVEDDVEIRGISAKLLSITGYDTLEADSRDQALEIMKEQQEISAVLMDLTMPGMTVDEFISKISTYENKPRVVFSSGQPEDVVKEYLDKSCNYRFLSKPYGLEDLHKVLDHSVCEEMHYYG